MKTVFIFDIDGTIANGDHRANNLEHFCDMCLQPKRLSGDLCCGNCGSTAFSITQESWDTFLSDDEMLKDTPIPGAIKMLTKLRELGQEIHFLTGRYDLDSRGVTEEWLRTHAGWDPVNEKLVMRQHKGIPASVSKEAQLKTLKEMLDLKDSLFIFFEDDPYVFKMFANHGIVVRCPGAWEHMMPDDTLFGSCMFPEPKRRR